MNEKWDRRFIDLAKLVSAWSKDPSTQCGAVITEGNRIISIGFNGFPVDTCDDPELYADRDEKYRRVLHAEQNAIMFAGRNLEGCTCYVWPMPPCSTCAAMLIQSGIARVVSITPTANQKLRWGMSFNSAVDMMSEAGVELKYYGGDDDQE